VHSFIRSIGKNPVTGKESFATAVLYISEPNTGRIYARIAKALASDYYNLFYVDLRTGDYFVYFSDEGVEAITTERRGKDFFGSCRKDILTRVYEKDQEALLEKLTRENILSKLDAQDAYTIIYRLIDTGVPVYAQMKITRMEADADHIIIGVSIIDAQMKQQEKDNALQQERIALGRIAALSPDYLVLYTVDPATGHYMQYNPSSGFEDFGLALEGSDFFGDVILDAPNVIAQEDMERHLRVMTRENMMREIQDRGFFVHKYRLLLNGEKVPVTLKATRAPEEDGDKILLGVVFD
jgi:hypothetical protein